MNDLNNVTKLITSWIKKKVQQAGAEGVIFGLSGGLDSAVVAALCKKAVGNKALGVIMPCYSDEEDIIHGTLVAKKYDLPYCITDLENSFDTLVQELKGKLPTKLKVPNSAPSNLKPRLRMATLYYYGACYNYLVAGTGNRSEISIGYFTKYGDGGVDLEPIGPLLKEEVKELAIHLGVPKEIVDKAPSAGLWQGQSDEEELGFSYPELDLYLKSGIATPQLKDKIEALRANSEHKRQLPPMPRLD